MNNILIIDDEEDILEILSDVIKGWGHLPIVARDGKDGLRKFQEVPVDLILSDIKMPNLDGISLLERVRSSDKKIPVILLTGYPSVDSAVHAMKEGAFDYITKPVNLDELRIKIDRGLERARMNQSMNFLKSINWSLLISIPIWLILGIILAKLLR